MMIKLLFEKGLFQGSWARFDALDALVEDGQFASEDELIQLFAEHESSEFMAILANDSVSLVTADMPIKQTRQIIKALPFAVEEQLASDIGRNHLVYMGKQGSEARAAVVAHDLMDMLSGHSALQGILPLSLILPLSDDRWSVCLLGEQAVVRMDKSSGFHCAANQLTLFIEHATASSDDEERDEASDPKLTLHTVDGEDHSLLVAQLETSGYDVKVEQQANFWKLVSGIDKKHFANLLVGQYKPAPPKKAKVPSVLAPLVGLAASVLIVGVFANVWQGKTNEQLSSEIRKASVAYYKSLFPGERVRSLKRDFESKLGAGNNTGPVNFTNSLGEIGQPLQGDGQFKSISLQNIRFNEKRGGFELDLTASTIAQLEGYKKALSEKGFNVEITSATNENSVIKGHLKVRRNG